MSVVIGAVGTGKSTMCRALLQLLNDDSGAISVHLILDPAFASPLEFLATIATTFGIEKEDSSEWQMKEAIKNYLLHQGIDKNIIPVLIIDEGQKLPVFCIEILREFLNYETNHNKLLEIVIFAQEEFSESLKDRPNFSDRITSLHKLGPLSFKETCNLVRYRIQQCRNDGDTGPELFPWSSLLLIFLLTKGYPRKIIMLCSKKLLAMLVKEKTRATLSLVWNSAGETSIPQISNLSKKLYGGGILILLVGGVLLFNSNGSLITSVKERFEPKKSTQQVVRDPRSPSTGRIVHKQSPDTGHKSNLNSVTASQPPPDELGYLIVLKGMSLSRMVTRVYGRFTEHNLRLVLKANPYLSNPAKLKVQTKIFFPRLPNSSTSKLTPILVRLGEFNTLQAAYDFLISNLKTGEAMRILPMWNGESRLFFLVVLEKKFQEEKQAQQAIARLDSSFRSAATVIKNLDGIPL
ncbi:MAG: AAA family ATPase [Deltaproteobacteria bacterium]|nr:AAA family ATPase [Deltaproteobacteria bacterium]